VRNDSARKFTSDRSRLVSVTWHVFENHPLVGVGVGGQPKASRDEVARRLTASRNKSHTSALTVAAELGLVGVLVYLAFLAGAATSLYAVYGRDQALGLGLAAVFVTLLIHSFFYAGFFEDPLTWGALAVAAAALAVLPPPTRPQAGRDGAPTGDVATLDGSPADRPTPLAADRVES
jgi:O-antigen ligase